MGGDWRTWGEKLNAFLVRNVNKLHSVVVGDRAAEDGIIMWDRAHSHPTISENGKFRPIAYGLNRYGFFYDTTDQTAAAANTAYALTWNATGMSDGASIGSPTSRIVFDHSGMFELEFTAQITSGSSSLKTLWFWPRVNGVDVTDAAMKISITSNGETKVISRSAIFQFSPGDYIEAMWATDDTNVTIEAAPSTAFAPATPSITLGVTEVNNFGEDPHG